MRYLVILALLLPLPAMAEHWIRVTPSGNDCKQCYIDTDSYVRLSESGNPAHRRVWFKILECGEPDKLTLLEFSCTGEYRALEQYTDERSSRPVNTSWVPIRPHTPPQDIARRLCGDKPLWRDAPLAGTLCETP